MPTKGQQRHVYKHHPNLAGDARQQCCNPPKHQWQTNSVHKGTKNEQQQSGPMHLARHNFQRHDAAVCLILSHLTFQAQVPRTCTTGSILAAQCCTPPPSTNNSILSSAPNLCQPTCQNNTAGAVLTEQSTSTTAARPPFMPPITWHLTLMAARLQGGVIVHGRASQRANSVPTAALLFLQTLV